MRDNVLRIVIIFWSHDSKTTWLIWIMWSLILILVMTSSQIGKIDRFRISDLNDRLDLGRFNPHAPSCGGSLRKSLPSITSSSIDQIEIPLDQSGSRNTALGSSGLLQTIFNQTRINQKPVSTGSSDSDQTKPRKTPKPKRNSFRGKLVSHHDYESCLWVIIKLAL